MLSDVVQSNFVEISKVSHCYHAAVDHAGDGKDDASFSVELL